MSTLACFAILACLASCRTSLPRSVDEVRAVAEAQQAAWNRGDVEGYMQAGYLRAPELTFFSGGDDTRGYEPVLARYVERYATGDGEMGHLEFSGLETVPLGDGFAMLRGRWHLDLEKKDDVGGLFTLVLRDTDEGWRIVHDHTSVASP